MKELVIASNGKEVEATLFKMKNQNMTFEDYENYMRIIGGIRLICRGGVLYYFPIHQPGYNPFHRDFVDYPC